MILGLLKGLVPIQVADAAAFNPDNKIKPGEEVVGVLDGDLLALWVCMKRQTVEQQEPKLAEEERLRKVFEGDPSDANRAAAMKAIAEAEDVNTRIKYLSQVFWTEAFETIPALADHSAGIREGFQIVRFKEKEEQRPHGHMIVACMPFPFPFGPPDEESPPDGEPHS